MTEILLPCLLLLIVFNVPIAYSIALATSVAIYAAGKAPLFLVSQRMFTGVDSFTLLAIPLFMLAGSLMEKGGISRRLIDLAGAFVGHAHGGLGIIAVIACMFFAAISGSAPATVLAIGSIMVPAMIEAGYDKAFSVALMAAAGIIGVLIPPSIPFVTYGVSTNASIGKLFAAGIVPGILSGLILILICYVISRINGYKAAGLRRTGRLAAVREASWCVLMPVIILGGIYSGIFTPTESAAVACLYTLFIGVFIYKELNLKLIFQCLHQAAVPSAMVLLIIGCATAMGWVTTAERAPHAVAAYMAQVTDSRLVILMLLNVALLLVGCLMELNAAIILLGPIILPMLLQYKIDPIHFGVIMVVNLAIGLLTPPLGINLFVANGLRKDVIFKDIVIKVLPMLTGLILLLLLLTYIPQLSLFLTRFL
ncbi:MAG: TRAP transporter large permease [Deltaproteobacteria bacterium]|jgi:C4-dicarboxylate transporter DctM subunit|nr:TRAP transporter large permease [Deltaproteobacteria bacterium]